MDWYDVDDDFIDDDELVEVTPKSIRLRKKLLLVMCGDEDDGSIGPALFIKRSCRNARLWICPASGHTLNIEEPGLFNRNLLDFLTLVVSNRWKPRDPRSVSKSA